MFSFELKYYKHLLFNRTKLKFLIVLIIYSFKLEAAKDSSKKNKTAKEFETRKLKPKPKRSWITPKLACKYIHIYCKKILDQMEINNGSKKKQLNKLKYSLYFPLQHLLAMKNGKPITEASRPRSTLAMIRRTL